MAWHQWKPALVAVFCTGVLGGCGIAIDAPKPGIDYYNESSTLVRVRIVGAERDYERPVASGGSNVVNIEECVGTGIVVETLGGDQLGRVDEPACAGWRLTINPDLSLHYEKY